eukprot:CAMPEP_0182447014 /NCGR_PEP_ID=MMETSP1172-20130603/10244_1 /TAXON_ID=708627 /ORGANISM="Timspurckia oligopyrenoides, Strain CCMP3278" /LENGTH=134 /DNA_ID=CAMNT_0024643259 /DNA_START=258 /DNA_END=659 /DNA_ORIENTATION=+
MIKEVGDIWERRDLELEPVVRLIGFGDYLAALECSSEHLVVMKFFAPWCRSCKAIDPTYRRLAREFKSVLFCDIDFSENKELARRLGISSLPAFQFYDGTKGRIEDFSAGPKRIDMLREKLELHTTQNDEEQSQ